LSQNPRLTDLEISASTFPVMEALTAASVSKARLGLSCSVSYGIMTPAKHQHVYLNQDLADCSRLSAVPAMG